MTVPDIAPGIKIGTHVAADVSDAGLLFLRQLGISHVRVHFAIDQDDPAFVCSVRARFRQAGIEIFSVVYMLYQAREIAFSLPGRDAILERFRRFLRTMGENGLHTLEYDFFLYAPLPATGAATTRHCPTRAFNLEEALAMPPVVDLALAPADMWSSYHAFMDAVLPVAEESGVRLALHPDDPPVPRLLGVPRIFAAADGLIRAMEAFDSPAWGVLFCIGTWAEGGDAMGMTVREAIRFFAARGKLFTVHFRNVTSPLPSFAETFLGNGYVNMAAVMDALIEVGFDGIAIPDHFPELGGDSDGNASLAYAVGTMQGMLATHPHVGRISGTRRG